MSLLLLLLLLLLQEWRGLLLHACTFALSMPSILGFCRCWYNSPVMWRSAIVSTTTSTTTGYWQAQDVCGHVCLICKCL